MYQFKKYTEVIFALIVFLLYVGASRIQAQEVQKESKGGKILTIIGEVVDTRCYIGDDQDQKGSKHQKCATMCAKAGAALAILQEKTNNLYLIMPKEDGENPNMDFMPFIAKNVLVSGKVFEVGGMKAIIPSAVKEKK